MLNLARQFKRQIEALPGRAREKRDLAPLYRPDPDDLDLARHLQEAIEWLERAQDAGSDRGVAYGTRFGADFDSSYPETTGYICQTFVERERATGDADLLQRAIAMGDWEISIQVPDGAVMGGKYGPDPSPAVFNTGMVLLGWAALVQRTGEERFKRAAARAADWLLSVQEPDGNWIRGNSRYALHGATLYNVKAAWGLCEAGMALGDERYVKAALRNAEYCLTQQNANGWFRNCCLSDPVRPLLHTIAYTMQGLLGVAKLTQRDDLMAAARRTADAELRLMDADGFIPGRQDEQFRGVVKWCCLTGSAQTSIVWSELYAATGEAKYLDAARRVNRYLMARHDIRNADLRLRGGLPGSWPVWGDYGRLTVLNWATKFFVDALVLEQRLSAT